MAYQINGKVIQNRRIQSPYFILGIHCPPIANHIQPGQFMMLKVSEDYSPFLRRPFSVYKTYPENDPAKEKRGCVFICYKEVGKGTHKMTTLKKGDTLNLIGPLGNGFTLPPLPSSANIILIGGGVGIVSIYPIAEASRYAKMFVFIGGKTEKDILCVEDFKKFNSKIFIATENGSLGFRGTVIDLFLSQKNLFAKDEKYHLYSCGPMGMLKALTGVVKSSNFIGQASLETRMGCGFGACWGCVVKTSDIRVPYQRVCKEGPVFSFNEIQWD